jgi:hypothetical protein
MSQEKEPSITALGFKPSRVLSYASDYVSFSGSADGTTLVIQPKLICAESDRQAMLLALATLALHRPGWDYMLGEIAEKLRGREMFAEFKRLNNDRIAVEEPR